MLLFLYILSIPNADIILLELFSVQLRASVA